MSLTFLAKDRCRGTTGVSLHKELRWLVGERSSQKKLFDWKIRYEKSDNVAVRSMRGIKERIGSLFGRHNEVSGVLTEIAKIDASFHKGEWLQFCEKEVIPNVLEAFIRGDLDVLQDWCHKRAFVALSTVVKECQKMKFSTTDSRIIDIGKKEEYVGFLDKKILSADTHPQCYANTAVRVHHVWVMRRDMEEYNGAIARKLLEVHMQQGQVAL
ncbi:unnamed protein product [Cylicocyclus nassatus]|uniref:Tim44-like domain-containing protein n=1 Tax=Cylicocyclus nassatus TaxID=53992 RepID=A0AA36HBQ2_CYLNA|nr:unnamed protein product [Cylicocyclus nassatus]